MTANALTDAEIEVIKSTAPVLAEHGESITEYFYKLLLDENPELKNIFNASNQRSGSQKTALAQAVYAYACYIDDLGVLTGAVNRIVEKHVSTGVLPEHYPLVGAALLKAIDHVVSPPAEIIETWKKAYFFLADILIAAEANRYEKSAGQQGGWSGTRRFIVSQKVKESELVTSFFLTPEDGNAIPEYQPGQYLSVYVKPDGSDYTQIRQYSLSTPYNGDFYRISVKREFNDTDDGLVSNHLHNHVNEGDVVDITPPWGEFTLSNNDNPVVLISGGVGITPVHCMLESLITKNSAQQISFIHGCVDSAHHSFAQSLSQIAIRDNVDAFVFYEKDNGEAPDNVKGLSGLIDLAKLPENTISKEATIYLCGPMAMMKALNKQLLDAGIPETNIHYEVFGPDTSLNN